MKKLTAIIAAAMIAMTVSSAAFAVPDDESTAETSAESSVQQNDESSAQSEESTKTSEENSEETSAQSSNEPSGNANSTSGSEETSENSAASPDQSSAVSDVSDNKAAESAAEPTKFISCYIEKTGMSLELPEDMYILTPGMDADDPTLAACTLTKQEVDKSFAEADTYIKAFAKDFSYDITVTIKENDRTKAIGNLTSLADTEVENIIEGLLQTDYAKGCSKNTFNNTLFLSLDMEYSSDNTKIYALQEYTVVKDANVMITLQSYNGELTASQRELMNEVMNSTEFEGIGTVQTVEDVGNSTVQQLDMRYLFLMIASIASVAALAAIIIVAIKRHQTVLDEKEAAEEEERRKNMPKNAVLLSLDEKTGEKTDTPADSTPDSSHIPYGDDTLFVPADEGILYTNERLAEEKKKKEATRTIPRLDSTTELEIPKNPYTPVGKAEAVAQPAMSVTSEIAKLSTISAEAKKQAAETANAEKDNEGTVIFAESAPKAHTEIEQIGESIFMSNDKSADKPEAADTAKTEQPEEELSEYEKRFGKHRQTGAAAVSASPIVPVDEDEKRMSKFEKHFGKPVPAAVKTPPTDTVTSVDILYGGKQTEEAPAPAIPVFAPRKESSKSDQPETGNITETDPKEKTVTQTPAVENPDKAEEETITQTPAEEHQDKPEKETITETPAEEHQDKPEKESITETPAEEHQDKPEKETIMETPAEEHQDKAEEETVTELPAVENQDDNTNDEITETTPSDDKNQEKEGIFSRIKKTLFEADDELDDDYLPQPTNKESTSKFISTIRDKLGRQPDQTDDADEADNSNADILSQDSTVPIQNDNDKPTNENTDSPSESDETKSPETERPAHVPFDDSGTEIYRAPEEQKQPEPFAEPHIELAIKKGEDGNIIIDSISDENGNSIQVEIKDGNAGLRAKTAEQSEHLKSDEESAESDKLSRSEKNDDTAKTVKTSDKPETSEKQPEEEKELSDYEKKFGRKTISPAPAIAEAVATITSAAAGAVSAAAISAAAKNGIESAADTAAEALETAAAVKDTAEKEATDEPKAADDSAKSPASEPSVVPASENPQHSEPEGEAMNHQFPTEENIQQQESIPPVPEQPQRPAFVFERDTGIIFEHAAKSQSPVQKSVTPFTNIPRLESVNAEDYNKKIEELRKAPEPKPQPRPEPAPQPPVQTAQPAPEEKIEFYTGYDDTLDPFAPGSGEMPLEALDKKPAQSFGAKLKKSIGKLFSSAEDEEN